jgi:DNA-binding NtrC family response regulator
MEKIKVAIWALDDDKEWLYLMQRYLSEHGINLVAFHEPDKFFDAINEDVDIVLLDVNIPDELEEDGRFKTEEGLRKIYNVKKNMLVILMTAAIDLSIAIGYLQANAIFRYVQKGDFKEDNNAILDSGRWTDFNCFEAIRIYIEQCEEEIAKRKLQELLY